MFAFKLCRELGYPHPDYLLDQLTSSQLSEWMVYDTIDPIGKWRDDMRASFISSVVTNAVREAIHGSKAKLTDITDFWIEWDEEKRKQLELSKRRIQTVEEQKSILLQIANMQNKHIAQENKK